MTARLLVAIIPFVLANTSQAEQFDWNLLKGTWAESVEAKYGCRFDNPHQTFVVSKDRKTLTFKLDRAWKIGTGETVTEYSAAIVSTGPNVLVIKYDPTPGTPDEIREWELRFIGPGTYRWRATSWREGQYNQVIGVKCS